ncbi:MAG: alginate lyase family protein [Desulfobacteraceae bacterium]|nr:alginate lyase family protein [Desulfobacteraceae bacterium]
MNLLRFFYTVKYLKPVQVYGRLWFKFKKVKIDKSSLPIKTRAIDNSWVAHCNKKCSFSTPCSFKFLNVRHKISSPKDWNNPDWDILWLYNLHYFDFLQSSDAENKKADSLFVIEKWITENPPGYKLGWDSYPTSLRIVNWIKWRYRGEFLSKNALESLAVQTDYLYQKLEFHLLGNHLLANAKALVFAGLFFMGKKAGKWLTAGLKILDDEINEQVLTDGGHFERSPMYHAIILEDILDLINVSQMVSEKLPDRVLAKWRSTAVKMIYAMGVMTHLDGEIAFFNDSAIGIAANYDDLVQYAKKLEIYLDKRKEVKVEKLPQTGYYALRRKNMKLIVDLAPIGPDYLPAHAHADTLSFELSVGIQRVLVNSGTSCYGESYERLRQRKTSAHNTLTVDNYDSSEVWKGFRVARRAKVFNQQINNFDNHDIISASHDGFKKLNSVKEHNRTWDFSDKQLIIIDRIIGSGIHLVSIYYHFHPQIVLKTNSDGSVNISNDYDDFLCVMKFDNAMDITINKGTYHPEFGLSVKNKYILCQAESELPVNFTTHLEFV